MNTLCSWPTAIPVKVNSFYLLTNDKQFNKAEKSTAYQKKVNSPKVETKNLPKFKEFSTKSSFSKFCGCGPILIHSFSKTIVVFVYLFSDVYRRLIFNLDHFMFAYLT